MNTSKGNNSTCFNIWCSPAKARDHKGTLGFTHQGLSHQKVLLNSEESNCLTLPFDKPVAGK